MRDTRVRLIRSIVLLLAVSGVFAGCSTGPSAPPAGAPQLAGPNWPPVGATWVTKGKNTGSFGNSTVEVTWTFLGKKPFEGRELIAVSNAVDTFYFNEQLNFIARVRGDEVLDRCDPFAPNHEFPLFVGKRWSTNFTYRDLEHNRTFSGINQEGVVETYEEVQTPAGRFNAFKIRRADPAYRLTYWLSPDADVGSFWVKWREERLTGHYLGRGVSESELVSYKVTK